MDAVKAFFAKYHAVPANDAGPCWGRASDAALLGWAESDCATWDRPMPARDREDLRCRMQEVGNELYVRLSRVEYIPFTFETGGTPAVERRMLMWWSRVFERIGFTLANVPSKPTPK